MSKLRPFAGLLWMALASCMFACMNMFARLASADLPWAEVAAVRAFVAAVLTALIVRSRGVSFVLRDQKNAWARSLFGTAAMVCTFYSLGAPAIALGDVATLSSLAPVFIALLSPMILGEPGGKRVWIATLLALLGVSLVTGPRFQISGHLALIALLGSFCSGMARMFLRRFSSRAHKSGHDSSEAMVLHFSLVSTAVMLMLALPVLRMPTEKGALLLFSTGVLGGLGQLSMTHAFALEKASPVGIVGYLTVVLSNVLGVFVLDEKPSAAQVVGTFLVVLAGALPAFPALRLQRL